MEHSSQRRGSRIHCCKNQPIHQSEELRVWQSIRFLFLDIGMHCETLSVLRDVDWEEALIRRILIMSFPSAICCLMASSPLRIASRLVWITCLALTSMILTICISFFIAWNGAMLANTSLSFRGNQGAIRLATGIWNDNGLVEYQNPTKKNKT